MNENIVENIPDDAGRKTLSRTRWGMAAGYAVAAAFVILAAAYIYSHCEDFAFVSLISLPYLVAAGLTQLLCFLIGALQFRLFLRHHGVCLRFSELMAVTTSVCLGNLLLPMRAGSGGAALYLKEVHGLSLLCFGVIFAGAGLLTVLVNTGLALFGFVVLYLQYGFFDPTLSISVACLFAACCYLCMFPPTVNGTGSGFIRLVMEAIRSWRFLSQDRMLLLKLTLLIGLISLLIAGCFYFIYRAMGSPLSMGAALITSTLGSLATLIPGVPGSLGIFDAVAIKIPQLFGLDTARSLCATLVYRLVFFSCAMALGVPGLLYLAAIVRSHKVNGLAKRIVS